ncbi:GNAT family N-acetyltransferase [Nocardia stercoris]|uniref:N-acetyltransferase n=1 Tax=Nocardia stercoris TaxID=2483361 RepID=A0A3M2L5A0_9NOCA|nr:GNAT family N-acetyltransferase [Nocardia stercoris]RMI31703.1 N-acetyltransferase [Nocardia stercoris]
MTTRLEHNSDANRYELYVDDQLAAYADYTENTGRKVRDFDHTVTVPEFRGRGLAGRVVEFALQGSRADGFTVLPSCSYVEKFVTEHPEFDDILAR